MSDRFVRLGGWLLIVGLIAPGAWAQPVVPNPFLPLFPNYARLMEAAQAQPSDAAKLFVVPKDRAAWDAERPAVLMQVGGEFEKTYPNVLRFTARFGTAGPLEGHPAVVVEPVEAVSVTGREPMFPGQFLRPIQPGGSSRKLPLVVLLVDPCPAGALAVTPGWDGRAPALVLTEMGFAVLIFDHARLSQWFAYPFPLQATLTVALDRSDIDPARVGVLGLGKTGMTALTLMARDPRVTCGIVAVESRAALQSESIAIKEASGTITTHFEELAALCAPRPLNLMVGEPLPLPPAAQSAGKRLERAAKGTYQVYGKEGNLSFSHFGEFGEHTSVSTRLQWLAGLEWLDKHFRPQGPTPLGHAAEPEPTFDPADKDVLNLTEQGIAGWASEMSGRDSTWRWRDGVVECRPRAHEYGWLRAPVPVSDYLLQVEWQVPSHGNAGIFMRAQPVSWFFPPSEENRMRVMMLGLTWPSRTGLELQTQDDRDANRYSTGSLYRHAAPAANPTHSPNQWNRSTVRARGSRIEVWNNGTQVLDTDLAHAADTLPEPPLAGYIGLQNHGNAADYRNIRLKRLMPEREARQQPVDASVTAP